jgi:type VI protein secretion system component Hcp
MWKRRLCLWTVFKQVENVTNLHRKMTHQGNMLPLKSFPIYRFDTENSALEYVNAKFRYCKIAISDFGEPENNDLQGYAERKLQFHYIMVAI